MELLDRYLYAVRAYLPPAQQVDIIRELRENVLSQLEDKETELGRALTREEQEALIKPYGHPALLGLRYAPNRHLIGPLVFPAYWHTLKISLGIIAIICVLLPGIALLTGMRGALANPLGSFFQIAALTFAWMTLTFAGLDYCVRKFRLLENWGAKWQPRSLPPIPKGVAAAPRSRRLAALISTVALGAWWLLALKYPFLMMGPTWGMIRLSVAWEWFYIPFILLVLVSVAQRFAELVWPAKKAFALGMELVRTGGGALVWFLLARSGDLIEPVRAAAASGADAYAGIYNTCFLIGTTIAGLVSLGEFARALWLGTRRRAGEDAVAQCHS